MPNVCNTSVMLTKIFFEGFADKFVFKICVQCIIVVSTEQSDDDYQILLLEGLSFRGLVFSYVWGKLVLVVPFVWQSYTSSYYDLGKCDQGFALLFKLHDNVGNRKFTVAFYQAPLKTLLNTATFESLDNNQPRISSDPILLYNYLRVENKNL